LRNLGDSFLKTYETKYYQINRKERRDKTRQEGHMDIRVYICVRASGEEQKQHGGKQEHCTKKFMASTCQYQ
jgi:hypothetical protein